MPSLLDIAPPELVTRDIKIEAGTVTVQGITGETWCELYARYPALKTLVGGIGDIADLDRASATLATASSGVIWPETTEVTLALTASHTPACISGHA